MLYDNNQSIFSQSNLKKMYICIICISFIGLLVGFLIFPWLTFLLGQNCFVICFSSYYGQLSPSGILVGIDQTLQNAISGDQAGAVVSVYMNLLKVANFFALVCIIINPIVLFFAAMSYSIERQKKMLMVAIGANSIGIIAVVSFLPVVLLLRSNATDQVFIGWGAGDGLWITLISFLVLTIAELFLRYQLRGIQSPG
jgi:hypothetical protein